MKSIKKYIGILSIATIGFIGFSYTDSYFEITKNLEIFNSVFKELNLYYVDDTKPGELMKTGIDAMLKSLDPYTNYIPESDIEDYRFMTTGEYGGIGSLIRKKGDFVIITEPYEGYPAQKAGLIPGDVLLEINGKSVEGKSTSDVSEALKGEANTNLELVIERPNEGKKSISLKREVIKLDDVPYYGFVNETEGIGYIKLNSFTATASQQVKDAYKALNETGKLKKLVFDLRGNGGGLLREAVNIVNFFVPKDQIVVTTKGKIDNWNQTYKALNSPLDLDIPLAVLIDEGSASASEIVSGSLQDLDRAVLVGQESYGKGLVQQTRPLSYNSQLKVTVAKYYIPSGRCIQRIDYSHRDDKGKATEVPDSLINTFKTQNGRPVSDGKGIFPDVEIEPKTYSNISAELMTELHIFEFANEFKRKHDSIAPVAEFKITDELYNEFLTFCENRTIDYKTKSEDLIEKFKNAAEKESYFTDVEEEYNNLLHKLNRNKKEDLVTFKTEIIELLENEIISRYYYQKGRIQSSLKYDIELNKAIEILSNSDQYNAILTGAVTSATAPEKGN